MVIRQLVNVYERRLELDKAEKLLEQEIARDPLDAVNQAYLADIQWKQGKREDAIERLHHVLKLEPNYQWVWDKMAEWGRELQRPQAALEMARDLTTRRGNDPSTWVILARMLSADDEFEERLHQTGEDLESFRIGPVNPFLLEGLLANADEDVPPVVDPGRLQDLGTVLNHRPGQWARRHAEEVGA